MSLIRKDAYDIQQQAAVASASAIDLEYTMGDLIDISGTTTITSIQLQGGHERTVRFTGALTLTNSSTLVLPGGANIITAAGDFAIFRGYADGTVRMVSFTPASGGGNMITKMVTYTQDATSTTHTGTVPIPAGAWLHNIQVTSSVLWTPTGAATMKVGDTADDDGYFTGIDLKATDLLVGEVLATSSSSNWGGKEGAYLVAATGRSGPVATNFGRYYAAGSNVTGIITVGTPANTAGRTFMAVTYSIGTNIAAVVA